jgi:predicted ATPase
LRVKNFKAVHDSGAIRLTPLTVFVGNNGSGKSSILEALETLRAIAVDGLDEAMQEWRDFEHIWHKGIARKAEVTSCGRPCQTHGMTFSLRGHAVAYAYSAEMVISQEEVGGYDLFIQRERLALKNTRDMHRDARGHVTWTRPDDPKIHEEQVPDGMSILKGEMAAFLREWQFLSLAPQAMGSPVTQRRTSREVQLAKDGSNIAEYLLGIRKLDRRAFDGILEAVQYVLPYASGLQPKLTSELERAVYLQMTEGTFKVPGWLLSTGTLRLVALLAVFRHPTPPPVIAIEEIENGLDPRSLHLIVEEIHRVVATGHTQVIATTHSPYLLDLLRLSQLVLVERTDGEPRFTRPADQATLRQWAKDFAPGQLYTMGRLGAGAHP